MSGEMAQKEQQSIENEPRSVITFNKNVILLDEARKGLKDRVGTEAYINDIFVSNKNFTISAKSLEPYRSQIENELKRLIDNPGLLAQGNSSTCFIMPALSELLNTPEGKRRYVEIVANLLFKGEANLQMPNGKTTTLRLSEDLVRDVIANDLKGDGVKTRLAIDALLQNVLMDKAAEFLGGKYNPYNDSSFSKKIVTSKGETIKANWSWEGLYNSQGEYIRELLLGTPQKAIIDKEKIMQVIESRLQSNMPTQISMKYAEKGTQHFNHALLVVGIKDGRVFLRNSVGISNQSDLDRIFGNNSARRYEGNAFGYERVDSLPIDEFKRNVFLALVDSDSRDNGVDLGRDNGLRRDAGLIKELDTGPLNFTIDNFLLLSNKTSPASESKKNTYNEAEGEEVD